MTHAQPQKKSFFNMNVDLMHGPILKSLLLFMLPILVSNLFQQLYNTVDTMIVGNVLGDTALAAIGSCGSIYELLVGFGIGIGNGLAIVAARSYGAQDEDLLKRTVVGSVVIGLIASLVITTAGFFGLHALLQLLDTPAEILEDAYSYIIVIDLGVVVMFMYNLCAGLLRAIGNSVMPLVFLLISSVLNVGLDLWFIAGVGMGVRGAAVATVIAQASSFFFSIVYMKYTKKHSQPFRLKLSDFKQKGAVRRIISLGLPIAAQDFQVTVSFLIITSILNSLGVVASASVGIAEKLFVFLALVPMSFMSALSAFVAQNVGANNISRATKAFFVAVRISFCCGFMVFLLTFLQGDFLASIFTNDPEVIASTQLYLKSCSFEYLLTAINFCMLGYFNGRGRTKFVLLQGVLTVFLVRIPLSYFLSRLPGTNLLIIGIAVPMSALFELLLCIGFFIKLQKEKKVVMP